MDCARDLGRRGTNAGHHCRSPSPPGAIFPRKGGRGGISAGRVSFLPELPAGLSLLFAPSASFGILQGRVLIIYQFGRGFGVKVSGSGGLHDIRYLWLRGLFLVEGRGGVRGCILANGGSPGFLFRDQVTECGGLHWEERDYISRGRIARATSGEGVINYSGSYVLLGHISRKDSNPLHNRTHIQSGHIGAKKKASISHLPIPIDISHPIRKGHRPSASKANAKTSTATNVQPISLYNTLSYASWPGCCKNHKKERRRTPLASCANSSHAANAQITEYQSLRSLG